MSKTVNTRKIRLFKDNSGMHIYTEQAASERVIGFAKVLVIDLNVRKGPGTNYKATTAAKMGKTYRVYEIRNAGGYRWFNIGAEEWIADLGDKIIMYVSADD